MNDKEAVEAVAQAIADVKLFLRVNVGGSDSVDGYPVEICRYGDEGEDEIVVIARFDASSYENDLLSHFVREHRARAALAAARPHILEEAARPDYFGELVLKARVAAEKASLKFPQPNYVTLKIAEEAGEVVRGAVHYAEGRLEWEEVEGEIVQLLAMLIRFVTEGDQINGVIPPAAIRAAKETGE